MASNQSLLELYASLRRAISLEATAGLKESGFNLRQCIILRTLHSRSNVTVTELVEWAMTDAATVSRSIQQMAKSGLVEKVKSEVDGRVSYVRLTKKGESLVPSLESVHRAVADRCFSSLKVGEKAQLSSLLGTLVSNLEGSVLSTAKEA